MRQFILISVLVLIGAVEAHARPATRSKVAKSPATAGAQPSPPSRSNTPQASPVYYDFKGAKLGMRLEEWRALPPLGLEHSYTQFSGSHMTEMKAMPKIYCSTDMAGEAAYKLGFYLDDLERSLGVVECGYKVPSGLNDTLEEALVPIGEGVATSVVYSFIDGKLFRISIDGKSSLLDEIMSGLRAKFGEPTSKVDDTTQNKAGASFPHVVRLWMNPVAFVRVEAPWTRIDDLNVTYTTTEGAGRLNAARQAKHPDITKM